MKLTINGYISMTDSPKVFELGAKPERLINNSTLIYCDEVHNISVI
jgi:hypothetical protein